MSRDGRAISKAEWVARMAVCASNDREAYRQLRQIAWSFVVENSARSDFPTKKN